MKNKLYLISGIFSIIFLLIFILKIRSMSSPVLKDFSSLSLQKSSGDYVYENTNNKFQTYFKDSPLKESSVTFKTAQSQISFYTLQQQKFGSFGLE